MKLRYASLVAVLISQASFASGIVCENAFKEDSPVKVTAAEFTQREALLGVQLVSGKTEVVKTYVQADYDPSYKPRPENNKYYRYNIMKGETQRSEYSLLLPKVIRTRNFNAILVESGAGYHGEAEYTRLVCRDRLTKFPSGPRCENYAKYGAIRAYRKEFGGDGDISATAKVVSGEGDVYAYYVDVEAAVNDGADDGWDVVTYEVDVRLNRDTGKCTVQSARKIKLPN